jgi:hypothetical protein
MIELDSLLKLRNAPVHLISDDRGMVIGNSQALAIECLRLRAMLEKFYEPHDDCKESGYTCDYRVSADDDHCPCQQVRGLT